MKRILIRELGPIAYADILLRNVNVIIGEQSIGKSCVLKVACFCTWVEKRIEIAQSPKQFQKNNTFLEELIRFHRLNGYIHKHTFISYESDYMVFSYDFETKRFSFKWKDGRFFYKRPKVSYIPAERNIVAVIPNWYEVRSVADNVQDFMADWAEARKAIPDNTEILNLGVFYHFEEDKEQDFVKMRDGNILPFTNVSSGLQSLIPLFVHLLNITSKSFRNKEARSVKHKKENEILMKELLEYYNKNIGDIIVDEPSDKPKTDETTTNTGIKISPETTLWMMRKTLNIVTTDHCEIFLEEPEQNLFPPTQQILMKTLLSLVDEKSRNTLFISSHSPYIIDILLERPKYDFGMFYIQSSKNGSIVKAASEQDIQDMYDDGVDAFFNIDRLGHEA